MFFKVHCGPRVDNGLLKSKRPVGKLLLWEKMVAVPGQHRGGQCHSP